MTRTIKIGHLVFVVLWTGLGFACREKVSEEEFLKTFRTLSDTRLEFRRNMKALGDSSRAHRDFATEALANAWADTSFEKLIHPGHAAYADSIRKKMELDRAFFVTQYVRNKPLIGHWEKTEMRFDNLVQQMKRGELDEKEGLDSMNRVMVNLKQFIQTSDSLLTSSNERYWAFRRTILDFQYNRRNLRMHYAETLFQSNRPQKKKP